jgi:THAP4-like, heme-binding beta-barrel domain
VPGVSAPLHAELQPIAGLLGTWVGEGEGGYPTIEPFHYREEVEFGHVGKPYLTYRQATINLGTGEPAHAEVGYLRAVGDGRVELVLAHPTGLAELAEGTTELIDDGVRLHLRSTGVSHTTTAKDVTRTERRIEVTGDVLRYDLAMAAVGQGHQHHLSGELRRQA